MAGLRRSRVGRRLIAGFALVAIALWLAIVPVLFLVSRAFGGGERADRTLLLAVVALLGLVLVAAAAFSDASPGRLVRSRWLQIGLVVMAIGTAWALLGIDSARPLRELPEATLAYPSASETGRWSSPREGGVEGAIPASFTRAYVTGDDLDTVLGWYDARLTEAGWISPGRLVLGGNRWLDWRRDGYTFQIAVSDPVWDGRYSVRIWGG